MFGKKILPTKTLIYNCYTLFGQCRCICKGKKALGDDQSLKFRCMNFKQVSFTVHESLSDMLCDSEACHTHSSQCPEEASEI
jgi:hypothetical protein